MAGRTGALKRPACGARAVDAATLLPELIRAARDGPHAVLATLAPRLASLGFAARESSAEPRAVLWTRGEGARLALSGHVDVVPAGVGWTRDAFGGEVAEGRVWGRGACDMLGAVACFVAAAARAPDASLAILLTTDEETGMHAAESAIAEGMLDGVEAAVVGEPTDFEVGIAEKGVCWLRVTAHGVNAHGSMPHLGENAAERLVRVLAALDASALAEADAHPLLGRATMNLGTLHAGEAVNQVPAIATAQIDARYLPGMRAADVVALVESAAARAREQALVEVESDHAPFETRDDALVVRAALDALAVVGVAPRIVGLPYGTEASKLAPAGVSCVILGPGEPGLAHTNKESVSLDALARATSVYARMIEAFA